MNKNYYIWIEIQANKKTIVNAESFRREIKRCKKAGIGAVILSVKDTSGFVVYDSKIAPHYSEYDETFEYKDYLSQCLEIIRELGMSFYAAVDVFAEGNKKNPHPRMPGIRNKAWQTYVYGLNETKKGVVRPVTCETPLQTVGSIDDFGEIFVNPANEEVCAYELSLLEEIMTKYPVDGIVLDRVRYVGLSSDFGPVTKEKWEQYTGKTCEWPEEIYKLIYHDNIDHGKKEPHIQYGKYFGEFLTFRAVMIKNFIERVRKLEDRMENRERQIQFMDYAGSWYPQYYQVGANWASQNYRGGEALEKFRGKFPQDEEEYRKTGYAQNLDGLLSGFYYPYVTEDAAKEANQPAYWYSVEGSARIAYQVTENVVPITGGLFLDQYRDNLEFITKAVRMCFQKSEGCMLFDLSYLVNNNWWSYITIEESRNIVMDKFQKKDIAQLSDLWKECFSPNFWISERKLLESTFGDESLREEASFVLRRQDNQLIGAVVVKASKKEDELYSDCAWLTVLLVKPEYQGLGYGKRLYREAYRALIRRSVKKIFVGQDKRNLFSGIPDPTEKKVEFFKSLGFTLNTENHYDLEGDIVHNDKIDRFDRKAFQDCYIVRAVKEGEEEDLYRFLSEEFPGRWFVTVKEYLEQGKNRENIVVLKDQKEQKIRGFCMAAVHMDGRGGLGPIGIAKSIRGKKIGDFLLQQSLLHLRKLGADNACIDWTILKGFYGKFGFNPVRIYRGAYKEMNY